jgi:hypothetical protein
VNIKEALLKEHSKLNSVAVANWIGDDKDRVAELIDLFLNSEYRVTQRAAYAMLFVSNKYIELFQPYIGVLLNNLENKKVHIAVKRNTIRLFQNLHIPEKFQGQAAAICFEYLESTKEAIAVKCFAMKVLANICESEPDLIPELKILVENQYPHGSSGFQARSKHIFKHLKIKSDII